MSAAECVRVCVSVCVCVCVCVCVRVCSAAQRSAAQRSAGLQRHACSSCQAWIACAACAELLSPAFRDGAVAKLAERGVLDNTYIV